MWRRLLTSQFKSLAAIPCRSASKTAPFPFKSHISPSPSASLLVCHFSAESGNPSFVRSSSSMRPILVLRFLISIALVSVADTAVKKKVEDVMPIATGHEREELESELQAIFFPFPGKKILEDANNPVGPFGTKEAPAVVKSYYDKRIVGCPGGEGEDEHDVVWFWLEKGKPHECPVCSQYFVVNMNRFKGEVRAVDFKLDQWFIQFPVFCLIISTYVVQLEVVGPGGPPDGHGDDDHH
ncbi:hypothetical protein Goshw_005677 [Gossypium schwendimanii]|uniref:Uncharacterized protein n=1 Tax=Gossypium schwendimanii TaxID=34291 RepID=A0A7J9MG69_GOSSC|nr:hypothetical protein [Gossypium schwendimanii]